MPFDPRLYLVTDRKRLNGRNFLTIIENAINAGVTMVQLREKEAETGEFIKLAADVKQITAKYSVPLWINDRVDVALAVGAEGVQLGRTDMPLTIARKLLPKGTLLGCSVATAEEAMQAENDGADLICAGAVFHSDTKTGAPGVDQQTLFTIRSTVSVPVVAFGGINQSNIDGILACGINGVEVSSAIMYAESPSDETRALRIALDSMRHR